MRGVLLQKREQYLVDGARSETSSFDLEYLKDLLGGKERGLHFGNLYQAQVTMAIGF